MDDYDRRIEEESKMHGFIHRYNIPSIDWRSWSIGFNLGIHTGFIGLELEIGPIDWYIGWWRK